MINQSQAPGKLKVAEEQLNRRVQSGSLCQSEYNLKSKFAEAISVTDSFLHPFDKISDDDARTIIKRYVAAIENNFLAWLGAASVTARSVLAKFAADENLLVELKDRHACLLREFGSSAKSEPDAVDFQYVHPQVTEIRNLVSKLSGLKNIALMTALENTSIAFIPYLAKLAKQLGSNELTYTDVHGEADIKHADQFLEALSDELRQGYLDPEKQINDTISSTLELLRKIFCVKDIPSK